MSELNPLKNKLTRIGLRLTNMSNDILALAKNAEHSDVFYQRLNVAFAQFGEVMIELGQSTSRGAAIARELHDIGELPDALADAVISVDLIETLRRLDYVQLANLILAVDEELITSAFNEVASQDGWERINLLHEAAARKLEERS